MFVIHFISSFLAVVYPKFPATALGLYFIIGLYPCYQVGQAVKSLSLLRCYLHGKDYLL